MIPQASIRVYGTIGKPDWGQRIRKHGGFLATMFVAGLYALWLLEVI